MRYTIAYNLQSCGYSSSLPAELIYQWPHYCKQLVVTAWRVLHFSASLALIGEVDCKKEQFVLLMAHVKHLEEDKFFFFATSNSLIEHTMPKY